MAETIKNKKSATNKIKMSIRAKLMGIVSAIVLLSLGLLTFISLGIFEEDMTNMLTDMNTRTNKLLAEKVTTELEKSKDQILLFDRLRQDREVNANQLFSEVWTSSSILLLFATLQTQDNQKWYIESALSQTKALNQRKISSNELIKHIGPIAKNIKESLAGGILLHNISSHFNKPIWAITVPVLGKEKNSVTIKRILMAFVDAENFANLFLDKNNKSQQSIYLSFLVDRNGNVIIHPDNKEMMQSINKNNHPVVKKLFEANTRSGLIRYKFENKEFFGAYSRLELGNLGLITTIQASRALEGVNIARVRSLLISLLIISIAILFIYFFSKTISEPIKNLAQATNDIVKGHYGQKIQKKTNDELGELTDAFNAMSEGLEEREKLKGALGKFVNEEIAQQVLDGELRLGGERKEGVVFFSDIRSFTSISESMEPEQVVEFLNEYMSLMVGIIHNSGGVVDKFIGDAIMALWGIPVSKGNDIVNCLDAALAMRHVMFEFNEKRRSMDEPEIKIGCGINSGPVVAGQIGSEDRLEYTVIGDTVNLASRIEALNKPFGTDILVSEQTYKHVSDIYHCVAMDKIMVKGIQKAQQIYAVLGRKDDDTAPKTIAQLRQLLGIKNPAGKAGKSAKKGKEQKYEILKK